MVLARSLARALCTWFPLIPWPAHAANGSRCERGSRKLLGFRFFLGSRAEFGSRLLIGSHEDDGSRVLLGSR